MFDLPEDSQPLGTEQIGNIQSDLGVMISIRQKVKQNTLAYIIKGIERNASKIYEARNQVLGITDPSVVADIPKSYFMSILSFETIDNAPPVINVQQPRSPMISPSWPFSNPQMCQPSGPFMGMMRSVQYAYNNNTIMQGSSLGSSG